MSEVRSLRNRKPCSSNTPTSRVSTQPSGLKVFAVSSGAAWLAGHRRTARAPRSRRARPGATSWPTSSSRLYFDLDGRAGRRRAPDASPWWPSGRTHRHGTAAPRSGRSTRQKRCRPQSASRALDHGARHRRSAVDHGSDSASTLQVAMAGVWTSICSMVGTRLIAVARSRSMAARIGLGLEAGRITVRAAAQPEGQHEDSRWRGSTRRHAASRRRGSPAAG